MHTAFRPRPTTSFRMKGNDVAVLADAEATDGAWEVTHQTVAPGGGSPLHTLASDKLFFVVEGELVLDIDGEEHLAAAGSSATVPAGVAHRFENRSAEGARLLVVTSGSSQVRFLAGMSQLTLDGPPDPEQLAAHAAAHRVTLLV